MKRPWILLTFGGLALAAIVGGAYALLASRRPAPTPAPTFAVNPIAVQLRAPKDGDRFPVNGSLPVSVSVESEHGIQVVQVWLDGEWLTDIVPLADEQSVNFHLPAGILAGDEPHTLVAVAVDRDGRSRPGNAVRLTALPPVEAQFIVTAQEGDSLSSIAQEFGQTVPPLLQANARLLLANVVQDENQILPAGVQVRVPLSQMVSSPTVKLDGERHPVSISPDLPIPPSASITPHGCDVAVQLTGPSSGAEGYRLYRLDPDRTQFQLVGELADPGSEGLVLLEDAHPYGAPIYYVAAYNSQGETSGPLMQVASSDPGCLKPSGLSLSDGVLRLPAEVERAYLYAAINGGEYNRWPRQQGEFLIPQDGALDLHPLTDSEVGLGQDYPFEVNLEVWGWTAGQLQFLGTASGRLERTRLAICNLEGGCSGDMGSTHFVEAATVPSDSENQVRQFRWSSSLPSNPTAMFQLSTKPFGPGNEMEPEGLLYSRLITGYGDPTGSGGTFQINFANLGRAAFQLSSPGIQAQAEPLDQLPLFVDEEGQGAVQPWPGVVQGWQEPSPWQWLDLVDIESLHALADMPLIFYARVVPLEAGLPSGSASNAVRIEYRRLGPRSTPNVFIDTPPFAYEVSIVGFNPPTPPSLPWGCVDILAVDETSWVWMNPYWAALKHYFLEARDKGWAYCPTSWQGMGEPSWYESFLDFVQGGVNWLSQAYEDLKSSVVDFAASGLNLIPPGDLCGESCKSWLESGLDAGLAALGIPPSLPDFNKLTDMGIAYLVEEGIRQMNLDWCGECQEILIEALQSLKDEMLERQVDSYANADVAHEHGKNPLLLPPEGLTVRPNPGSSWQMAYATLRITRTGDGAALSASELRKYGYFINVRVEGYNEWMVGRTIGVATAICYNDASMWPCEYRYDEVTSPLEGTLFGGSMLVLDLAPGQSTEVQVILLPHHWWYGDHEKYASNTWEWDDDWWDLYNHGQGRMTATIYAYGIGSVGTQYPFTISEAGPWEFDLPLVDLQGMNAPD